MAFSAALKEKLEAWVGAGFDDNSEAMIVGEFIPYNLVSSATKRFYFGTRTYRGLTVDEDGYVVTGFVDPDYVGTSYPCPSGLLLPSVSISVRNERLGPAMRSGALAFGAVGIQTFGGEGPEHPVARSRDRLFEGLTMANRQIRLYMGLKSDAWGDFEEIPFSLLAAGEPQFSTETNTWTIPVKSGLFDPGRPIHDELDLYFKGTGGLEGPATIRGKEKPLAYGQYEGLRPAPIDNIRKRYLIHGVAENCEALTTVYAGGLSVPFTADSSNRFFDLDNDPGSDVEVTCDGKGAKPGGTYISLAGDIAKELFTTHGGVASASVDLGTYNTDFPQTCRLVIPWGQRTTMGAALEQILAPRGIWISTDKVKLTARTNPREGAVAQAYAPKDIRSLSAGTPRRPAKAARVGYAFIEQPLERFVGAVTGAEQARQSADWKYSTGPILSSPYANATQVEAETPWVSVTDANAEATAQLDLNRFPQRPYSVDVHRKPLFSDIGDVVSILDADGAGNARFALDVGGNLTTEAGDNRVTEAGDNRVLEGEGVTRIQVDTLSVDLDAQRFSIGGLGS